MAGAREHADGGDGANGTAEAPLPFRRAVEGLHNAPLRPQVEIAATRPPQRLAPYSHALEAAVVQDDEDLSDGRLVLLHAPEGHEAWNGTFRLVTLVRAELEAEMAADPLLPEVCWSWLTGAFDARGVECAEPSATVTLAGSHYFGALASRPPAAQIEIRASWTPAEGPGGVPDTGAHLAAWCELLCQIAGLPPEDAADGSVLSLRQRSGPHPR